MPKDKTGDAAFTLTEAVISVVLMLLVFSLLLSSFVSSKRSVALAQTHLTALQIARNEAERLQTNAYANIVPANATLTNALIQYTMSNSVVTTNNYKDITISVNWISPVSSRLQASTNYMTICNPN